MKFPLLMVDASSLDVQVALLGESGCICFYKSKVEALESIFEGVKYCFSESGLGLEDLAGFLFCQGPGSTLGIRLGAMAISSWQCVLQKPLPVYQYRSLEMAAALLSREVSGAFQIISDLRKGHWNVFWAGVDSSEEGIKTISSEDLAKSTLPCYHLAQRKGWHHPPDEVIRLDYNLKEVLLVLQEGKLFSCALGPEVYESVHPDYKRWSAKRHR